MRTQLSQRNREAAGQVLLSPFFDFMPSLLSLFFLCVVHALVSSSCAQDAFDFDACSPANKRQKQHRVSNGKASPVEEASSAMEVEEEDKENSPAPRPNKQQGGRCLFYFFSFSFCHDRRDSLTSSCRVQAQATEHQGVQQRRKGGAEQDAHLQEVAPPPVKGETCSEIAQAAARKEAPDPLLLVLFCSLH